MLPTSHASDGNQSDLLAGLRRSGAKAADERLRRPRGVQRAEQRQKPPAASLVAKDRNPGIGAGAKQPGALRGLRDADAAEQRQPRRVDAGGPQHVLVGAVARMHQRGLPAQMPDAPALGAAQYTVAQRAVPAGPDLVKHHVKPGTPRDPPERVADADRNAP